MNPNRLLCTVCVNWDLEKVKYKSPPHYPKELFIEGDNQQIPFKKITYQNLIGAVNFAISRMTTESNPWNVSTTKAYLKCAGVNTSTITKIIEHTRQNITWCHPVLWTRGCSLEDHIDVPMHLLFLGVVRSTMETILDGLVKILLLLPSCSLGFLVVS